MFEQYPPGRFQDLRFTIQEVLVSPHRHVHPKPIVDEDDDDDDDADDDNDDIREKGVIYTLLQQWNKSRNTPPNKHLNPKPKIQNPKP